MRWKIQSLAIILFIYYYRYSEKECFFQNPFVKFISPLYPADTTLLLQIRLYFHIKGRLNQMGLPSIMSLSMHGRI